MSKAAEKLANGQIEKMKALAKETMTNSLTAEVTRLESLAKLNENVREDEIESLKTEQAALAACLEKSRSRIDSVRLIWKGSKNRLQELANS